MSTETDAFLAHYGKKGMHWGHRKDDTGGSGSSKKAKTPLTPEQKQRRNDTIKVAAGVAGVGLYIASMHLQSLQMDRNLSASTSARAGQNIVDAMLGDGTLNMSFAKIRKGASVVTSLK